EASPDRARIAVVAEGGIGTGQSQLRRLIARIERQCLAEVLSGARVVPRRLGPLRIREERQHTAQDAGPPRAVDGALIVGIDAARESVGLTCLLPMARGECRVPRFELCGQSLGRLARDAVEELPRLVQALQ